MLAGEKEVGIFLDEARLAREAAAGYWPNRVLTDYLDDTVRSRPDDVALIAYRVEKRYETLFTHAELSARVDRVAANLERLGIGKGDIVSFQLPNWWEFITLLLANMRVGAVSNPLMPIFRARELEFMIGSAQSKLLVVPRMFHHFDHRALARDIKRRLPSLRHVLVIGGDGEESFEDALLGDHGGQWASGETRLAPNDIMQLLYTSGTTGEPKGVMHTSNTLLSTFRPVCERLRMGAGDVLFMPAPFAHQIGFCYGIMLAVVLGAPLVTMDVWMPEIAADLVERYGVTYICGSTPFLADLINLPGIEDMDLSRFRLFLTSGAPVPESLVERAASALDMDVVSGWGMTETILATSTLPSRDHSEPYSDGGVVPGCEVRVVDENGRELPRNQEGRLQCRGSTLFVGYYRRPDLYEVDEGGWFETGDLARMDERGEIRIVGRNKDIIIRGGENIPVLEIENLIYRIPQVKDAALVAMPDERLGERGCAFVTLNPKCTLTLAGVVAFLQDAGVPRQYMPERLEVCDELPRTASGKIQKFALREMAKCLTAPAQPHRGSVVSSHGASR